MIDFNALASSSKGNAYTVNDGVTRILLECGITRKELNKRLEFGACLLDGVLVSHEHKDHAKCADSLLADGIPVYMSTGTADALGLDNGPNIIAAGEQFSIGSFDIVPFATFHDAAEPLGFLLRSAVDGDILAFATDTVALAYRFPGVNQLALEANYSKDILDKCEKMPEKVKYRILKSHMCIDRLCDYLKTMDLSHCRKVYLLHLSDATSHEGKFIWKVQKCVPNTVQVTACGRGK